MSKKSKTIAYNKFSNLIAASKSRKKCLQLQEMFEQLALEAKLRMDQILFDQKVLCTEYQIVNNKIRDSKNQNLRIYYQIIFDVFEGGKNKIKKIRNQFQEDKPTIRSIINSKFINFFRKFVDLKSIKTNNEFKQETKSDTSPVCKRLR